MRRFVALIRRQSRGSTVAVFAVFWGAAYMATNHFPLREPAALPFLPFEEDIPFMGWTVLVYFSAFVQGLWVAWLLDREALARGTAAAYGMVVVHVLIFATFPTTYPRPVAPPLTSQLIRGLYHSLCFADSPGNCFPSLHVSMAALFSLALWRCRPRPGRIFLGWSFLIILSTLTTKQHYALDAFGGLAIAFAAYCLAFGKRSASSAPQR